MYAAQTNAEKNETSDSQCTVKSPFLATPKGPSETLRVIAVPTDH